jgi:competence protein ComFC
MYIPPLFTLLSFIIEGLIVKINKKEVFVVKNTIFSCISELLCPHYCISCGKVGGIVCECCKKYIQSSKKHVCLACGGLLENRVCPICSLPFSRQFYVGERDGLLRDLIEVYKYHSVRAVASVLAETMMSVIDSSYTLVPLPTINRHIRERGFDHIGLICKKTGLPVERVLLRNKNTVQVGASLEQRREQAKQAYLLGSVDLNKKYLLVDDVWTTGSSMMAAANLMREAGVKNLAICAIARSI